ncbi:tyrosine--tRNA ligase [Capsulimonas corticalis]|uniref:Tyrosine--tRNA ligase n=1 Tax=Capsulimonas corticalis TaxID=2219043 RepID=A0A402CXP6_9BACT|nr:tyrosine--tRNA ligase [Capsulimonas corticalis]BDI32191.1 tyrosine--tRNA ligase [Capsulimonas corticalis]
MTLDIDQQIERISRGATEVLPLAELKAKLKRSIAESRPLQVKLGLDPTAPDIHIGNAVVLRKLRQFQDLGHEVTVIIGDFTATIGDPTGKSETRKQLTQEEVAANAKTYADQYHKILDPAKTRVVFNSEWLGKLGLYDIVTLLAKTTVARILERDDFDKRFRSGLPIHTHEMLYPICQGYDSVYLKSDIEIGGTEQRFNIMMGRDLQREHGIEPQIALFMPLLVGLDGVDKMSKSKGNAIGIDEPPLEMFGKIMSITDEMMPTYYELCTDVPMDEVKVLTDAEATHPNLAKRRLGREIIALYHGAEAAQIAEDEWVRIHVRDGVPDDAPEVILSADKLDENGAIRIAALVTLSGLVPSSGEAKRVVQQGGVSVSGTKYSDPGELVAVQTGQVLKVGKNRFARLTVAAG